MTRRSGPQVMHLIRAIAWALLLCAAFLGGKSHAQTTNRTDRGVEDPLLLAFQSPPDAAHPRVWWHWMNGNVTWDGVQKDMEWMKRVGIAGLQSFDAGRTTPQVVDERLPYMSEGWKRVFRSTAAYADKLDLELGIAASPVGAKPEGRGSQPKMR